MLKFSQKPINPERYFGDLIEFCKAQDDVVCLYLFGSRAYGNAGPLSDIDIAVLLKEGKGFGIYRDIEGFYWGKVNEILHTDEVSFVLLNIAPITIQYGVIADSRVFYCRDEEERLSFEERVINLYMDFKPILDGYDKELLRQIKEGTAFD